MIDEATAALDRAGQFLSAHLAGAEDVTASPGSGDDPSPAWS
jgi:hypothetical protein